MNKKHAMHTVCTVLTVSLTLITSVTGYMHVDEIDGPTSIVSIQAKSTGCNRPYEHSSIKINDKEISFKDFGLNVVTISPDGALYTTSFMKKLCCGILHFRERLELRDFFKSLQNGTIVVVVTDNACSLNYNSWPQVLSRRVRNLSIGNYKSDSHYHTGVIFGCYGYCPQHVLTGELPVNRFSNSDATIKMSLEFVLDGFEPPPITRAPQNKDTSPAKNNNTVIAVIIVLTLLFLLGLSIFVFIYARRNNYKCVAQIKCVAVKKDSPRKGGKSFDDVTSDGSSGQYAGLDMKRPSAIPHNYEALQKQSVQYEEINLFPDDSTTAENQYYAPEESSRNRAETQLSSLSFSAGTSKIIFQKSLENLKIADDANFAHYIKLDQTDVIYKAPSNVQKFDAPNCIPENMHRDSYVGMETNIYETTSYEAESQYAHLGDIERIEEDEPYQMLQR